MFDTMFSTMFKTPLATFAFAVTLPLAAVAQNQMPGQHFIENWDQDGDGQVTLAEATEKRGEIFYMFDQDENGMLNSAEYDLFDETREEDMRNNAGGHQKGAMKGVNQGMTREVNDTDNDGQVTEEEFLINVPAWFAKVDRNTDGVITTADFGRRGG